MPGAGLSAGSIILAVLGAVTAAVTAPVATVLLRHMTRKISPCPQCGAAVAAGMDRALPSNGLFRLLYVPSIFGGFR